MADAAGGGPVRQQAEEVVAMLTDPSRCQVLLVTTPEETPVTETVETARLIEGTGTKLSAVIVNARLPVLDLPASLRPAELARTAAAAGTKLTTAELESLVGGGTRKGAAPGSTGGTGCAPGNRAPAGAA